MVLEKDLYRYNIYQFFTATFLVGFISKQAWLGNLYRSCLILLPFFIVNGMLAKTGLSSPVVWCNDKETTGIRILTIPVEDIIYGFELVMLTVFFYEMFLVVFKANRKNSVALIIQHR